MKCPLAIGLLLLASSTWAADDVIRYRCQKEIQIKPRTREELVSVPLDADVYAAATDRLADLQIVGSDGRPVPFLLMKEVESVVGTTLQSWPARHVTLHPSEKGGLEIDLRLDPTDPQPQVLSVVTPLKNFRQQVQVFGVDAAGHERRLVENALIFDYSQYMDVSRQHVPLPKATERRFRVVVKNVTADQESQFLELTRHVRGGREEDRQERTAVERRPFRIDRLEFSAEVSGPAGSIITGRPWPVVKFETRQDKSALQTVVDVHTRREPMTSFAIQTTSRNFSRRLEVQVPETQGVRTVWRQIATATISQFQLRDIKQEHLSVVLPGERSSIYRLIIANLDNPALEITGVTAKGSVDRLSFLAEPGENYRLNYGAEVSHLPDYDTSALTMAIRVGMSSAPGGLGPEMAIAADSAPPLVSPRRLLNNPILIAAVIVTLVVVLGWSLFRASRRIENVPRDDT